MDYTDKRQVGDSTVLGGVRNFDLTQILECGQCFRWERVSEGAYEGIAFGRRCRVRQEGDTLLLIGVTEEEFERYWRDYFDLGTDYGSVKELLRTDPVMRRAIQYAPGLRVLRQEPWEALCSFIISQNNNVKRIRGIVSRLCAQFGGEIRGGGHAFPTPERLAVLDEEALAPLRCGFRARYILDAARQAACGAVDLDALRSLPLEEARSALRRIRGVGPKVAECALLYGLGRMECVPVDVWIARALDTLYPGGFPPEFRPVAGIAQQYLFHYARTCPGALQLPAAVR